MRTTRKSRLIDDRLDAIGEVVHDFSMEYLDVEYAVLASTMLETLARKRPSPLESGDIRAWAAAAIQAVGTVNGLFNKKARFHMTAIELCDRLGVGRSTLHAKAAQIRKAIKFNPYYAPEYTRRELIAQNPYMWTVVIDGIVIDLLKAPLELQQEALRQNLIPWLPGQGPT